MGLRATVRAVLRAFSAMFFWATSTTLTITTTFLLTAVLTIAVQTTTASANWFSGFGRNHVSTDETSKTPKISRNVTWDVSKDVHKDISTLRKGRSIAYLDTSVDRNPDTSITNTANTIFIPMDKPRKSKTRNTFKVGSNGRVDYTVSIDDEENTGMDFQQRIRKEAYEKGFKAGLIKGRNNKTNGAVSDNAWANLEEKNAKFISRPPKKKDEYAPVDFDPSSPGDSINTNAVYPLDLK